MAFYYQFNVTSKEVLQLFELNPLAEEIKQYECDDIKDDPIAMAAELSNLGYN